MLIEGVEAVCFNGGNHLKKLKLVRMLSGIAILVILLVMQVFLGKAGHYFANLVSYKQIDPYDIFARISMHHIIQMIIALIIIAVLSKVLKTDFYLKLGDVRKGTKYVAIFTAVLAFISIILHIFLYANNQLPSYNFPLGIRNVLGTLGFQLLLSGPSEEIVFRALPITMLIYAFGKSVKISGHITLEVILASILFALAHTKWSLMPFDFEVDYSQLVYSFVLGTIQGIVYQRSQSIIYPMLMHSISNVLMVGTGYLFNTLIVYYK